METCTNPLTEQIAELDYFLTLPSRGRLNFMVPTMIQIAYSVPYKDLGHE